MKKLFVEKFPFLQELEGNINPKVRVQRIDAELLSKTGYTYYRDGSRGVTDEGIEYYLVLQDNTLTKVPSEGSWGSNYAYSQSRSWEGMSIISFIAQENLGDGIKAIVKEDWTINDWPGQQYKRQKTLTVYLPSKSGSDFIPAEVRKYIKMQENKVEEEILHAVEG